jgi:hypothetical protein
MDKAIDSMNPLLPDGTRLKETQRSKYGKGDLTNVPFSFLNGIKDRLVDKSDPTIVYMKNKDKSIMSDEKRGDVYYDLKAEIKLLDKNNGTTDDLIAKTKLLLSRNLLSTISLCYRNVICLIIQKR